MDSEGSDGNDDNQWWMMVINDNKQHWINKVEQNWTKLNKTEQKWILVMEMMKMMIISDNPLS